MFVSMASTTNDMCIEATLSGSKKVKWHLQTSNILIIVSGSFLKFYLKYCKLLSVKCTNTVLEKKYFYLMQLLYIH